MRPKFELSPGPLLKSGPEPLARYGTHQETISGRPRKKYNPSDPRSEWSAEGPLFKPMSFRKFQIAYPDSQKFQHNIATTKIRKEKEKQVQRTLFGMKSKFQILFLDLYTIFRFVSNRENCKLFILIWQEPHQSFLESLCLTTGTPVRPF